MVSVCLPSDALLQHLPSYLGFFYFGSGVSLHDCSSNAQPLRLTLDKGYLLTTTLPDLQRGIASLGSPAPAQPPLLGMLLLVTGLGLGHGWLLPAAAPALGSRWLLRVTAPGLGCEVASPSRPLPRTQDSSSQPPPLTSDVACLLPAAPDLGHGVAPPGRRPDLRHGVSPPGHH